MAQHKLNVSAIGNCPTINELFAAFEVWGRPENESFGIIELERYKDLKVTATLCATKDRTVKRIDKKTGEMVETLVSTTTLIPFSITYPQDGSKVGRIETYAGSHGSIGTVWSFLKRAVEGQTETSTTKIEKPIIIKDITTDLIGFLRKLQDRYSRSGGAHLVGCKVSGYEHAEKVVGVYTPRFINSGEGEEFVQKHIDNIKSINVRWQGTEKKIVLTIHPNSSFALSAPEDEEDVLQYDISELIDLPDSVENQDEEVIDETADEQSEFRERVAADLIGAVNASIASKEAD
jgi:hypothetical protein